MKILAIRMKNVASLEGVTDIDFTKPPLNTVGIFAITGPTGAGKSTILDALCLALYGKTPRYLQAKEQGIELRDCKTGTISQGDCRGILRDGTGEGFAEVDFIGVDGDAYTACWRVRRARNNAEGPMQPDSLELRNLRSGTVFPGKKKEVTEETERLIGLNFEQFTRSVLLAQGDFTAFLKAAKDDKSSLLEKLTGTHIYSEISRRVFENYKIQEQSLRDLNIKREGILTLTAEELSSLDERNKSAKKVIELRQTEIIAFDKEITWYQQLKTLGERFELAGELVAKANAVKQNASGRLTDFKQVELVQPARKLIDEKSNITNQLTVKNENLATVEKNLSVLNKQQQASSALVDTASRVWQENTEQYNLAKPLLAESRELDVKISGKLEQVNDAVSAAKIATGNFFQKQEVIKGTKEKTEALLSSINELQKWKEDNESRQPIAEYESLIISKLSDANQHLTASQNYSKQIFGLSNDIAAEIKKIEKLNAETGPLKIKLNKVQDNTVLLTSKLSEVDLTKLETEKISIDNKLADLTGAKSHWENLSDKITDFTQSTTKLNDLKADHAEKLPELEKAVEDFSTVRTKKDISLELLRKASLAVAENVETLRDQLIPGEPCPVCGSQEHPYAVHNPQLNVVLQRLEAEHKKYEKAYEQALSRNSALKENILLLLKTMENSARELAEKESNLKTLNNRWKNFSVYQEIQNIPDNEKTAWLENQSGQTMLLQKTLQTKLATYNAQRNEQEELQKQVRIVEKQVNENLETANKSRQASDLLEQKLNHATNEKEKVDSSLQVIKISLAVYFSNDEWFHNWQKEPVVFEESITKFSAKWKEQTKKLVDDTTELHTAEATLKEQESQLQNLLTEQQSKQTVLSGFKQQHNELLQKRQLIFNGADAGLEEVRLKDSVEKAIQHLESQKTADNDLRTSIAKTATLAEQLQKDVTQLQVQELKAVQNTKEWLTAFNQKNAFSFDIDILLELLQHTPEWIEEERAALRAMDDAIVQAQSVLQERTTRLRQHEQQRLSERNLEEMEILRDQSATVLRQATQEKTETELLLQQDEANKKKIGDLLNAINAQAIVTDKWAKLNDIIGSSDGKKFRQMAQEYTLDVLLGYANMHLQSLSQRYLLQRIPNTLGLQVLDQDMGNEVRTVFSLSGGESFLVSLALALGLASLSSSRMQVESLFIDEGFGSLDPATLNIAMDALERLHNQGRKVGVISHVQEITERIPVQIKVSKENSGRSKVEII